MNLADVQPANLDNEIANTQETYLIKLFAIEYHTDKWQLSLEKRVSGELSSKY